MAVQNHCHKLVHYSDSHCTVNKIKSHFDFTALRPPNMPEGVFLPNVPSPQIPPSLTTPPSLPTTPLAPSSLHDVKIKQEVEERKPAPLPQVLERRAPPPSTEEKRKTDEVLGQLDSGLRHLIQTYDSDATESSSGVLKILKI